MASVSALTFRLFGEDVNASSTIARAGVVAEETGGKFGKMGSAAGSALAGVAVAVGVVGAASVKMAADFQTQMERLHTQAGVPQAAIKGLGDGVLDLAGKVGIGPTSLAEALYHVESSFASTGITGKNAMEILQAAAEGARMGGSNLVDTQNALDAAVVAGLKGVQNYQQAMGVLNATVGSGDMSMQDLADALGTGVLPVLKGFGVTLQDAGSALATFGDNNVRGAQAGTQLRMAVLGLVKPTADGGYNLAQMGLSAAQLTKDMQQGGLLQAISDLHDHMDKVGVSGDKVGAFLTDTFGKKAGVGLATLLTQFDRFQSKFGDINKAAAGFADAWQAQQATFNQQWKDLEARAEAFGVRIGTFLIPKILELGKAIGDAWDVGKNLFGQIVQGFDHPASVVIPVSLQLRGAAPGLTPGDRASGASRGDAGGLTPGDRASAQNSGAVISNSLSGWQRFGETVRHVVDGLKDFWSWMQEKAWPAIQRVASEIEAHLEPGFRQVGDFVSGSLLPTLRALWTTLGPVLLPALKLVGEVLAVTLIVGFRALALVLDDVIGPAIRLMATFWRSAAYDIQHGWTDDIKPALGAMSDAFTALGRWFQEVWTRVIKPALDAMGQAFSFLGQWFQDVWTRVLKPAWDAFHTLVFGTSVSIQTEMRWIETAFSGVADAARSMVGSVTGFLYNLWQTIVGWGSSAIHWLYQAGRDVLTGFWDGLKSVWTDVTGWIGGIASWIKDHKGPLSLDQQLLVPHGKAIMGGFEQGLRGGFASVGAFIGGVAGDVAGWIGQAIAITGVPANWAGPLATLIARESGGNPRAINLTDSNAAAGHPSMGLAQTIMPTFEAFRDPSLPNDIWNPVANLVAAIRYIEADYGTIFNVQQAVGPTPKGYAAGGFPLVNVPSLVGEHGAEVVTFGPGAQVHSNGDSRRMLSGGGGVHQHFHFHNVVTGGRAGARELATMVRTELVSMKAQGFPAVGL